MSLKELSKYKSPNSFLEDVLAKNKKEIVIYTPLDTFLKDIHLKYCRYLVSGGPFFFFETCVIIESHLNKRVMLPRSILEIIFFYSKEAVEGQKFILEYNLKIELENTYVYYPADFISWSRPRYLSGLVFSYCAL
jgi:hypothetical protein